MIWDRPKRRSTARAIEVYLSGNPEILVKLAFRAMLEMLENVAALSMSYILEKLVSLSMLEEACILWMRLFLGLVAYLAQLENLGGMTWLVILLTAVSSSESLR